MALTKNQATALGCISPVFWGLSVSAVRILTQEVGPSAGMAMTYILAAVAVFFMFGCPDFRRMPLKYYVCGFGSVVVCSLSFCYSLAIAQDGTQTMEVGMINYLWPSFTIVFAVLFNKQPAKWWLCVGILLAVYGICMVLSGSVLIDFAGMWGRIRANPLCYFLGLSAAVAWAAYSNFTKAWANGENPTFLVICADLVVFNTLWLTGLGGDWHFSWTGMLVAVVFALITAGAYGFWTLGVQKGRINILSIASYFTPVLSCLFASWFIGAELNHGFWLGVAVVVLGSFICWTATKSS